MTPTQPTPSPSTPPPETPVDLAQKHYPETFTDVHGVEQIGCVCGAIWPCPAFVPGVIETPTGVLAHQLDQRAFHEDTIRPMGRNGEWMREAASRLRNLDAKLAAHFPASPEQSGDLGAGAASSQPATAEVDKIAPPEKSSVDLVAPRPRLERGVFYERREDMSPDGRLTLLLQDDGDIIVACHGNSMHGEPTSAHVEFCSPAGGGGKSPRTREALAELMHAIREDNENAHFPIDGKIQSPASPEQSGDLGAGAASAALKSPHTATIRVIDNPAPAVMPAQVAKYETDHAGGTEPRWVTRIHHGPYIAYHYLKESADQLTALLTAQSAQIAELKAAATKQNDDAWTFAKQRDDAVRERDALKVELSTEGHHPQRDHEQHLNPLHRQIHPRPFKMTTPPEDDELTCPFCNERDFDAIGLKLHLTRGSCDPFVELSTDLPHTKTAAPSTAGTKAP